MDYKYIEQLLDRYWNCETSPEEEAILRAFFSQSDVPVHLLRYKPLFAYAKKQAEAKILGEDFDRRVMEAIQAPMPKNRTPTTPATRINHRGNKGMICGKMTMNTHTTANRP